VNWTQKFNEKVQFYALSLTSTFLFVLQHAAVVMPIHYITSNQWPIRTNNTDRPLIR
jgi:hypothetical protein